jgi:tRNA(fMet)-specific endonuclease VapC
LIPTQYRTSWTIGFPLPNDASKNDWRGTCIPVVGELCFGADLSRDSTGNRKRIHRGLQQVICWPYTMEASEKFGEIAAYLKRTGQMIQQIDMRIAAIALTLGNCTVVTTDSDFKRIPGLCVENWRETA